MAKINVVTLRRLCLRGIISITDYCWFKKIIHKSRRKVNYTRTHFNLDNLTEDECLINFRFNRSEIETLLTALGIPRINWLRNRIKYTGAEGLCILLRRLSYPNRWVDIVPMFKRHESNLSLIFNDMLQFIFQKHCLRLKTLQQPYLSRQKLHDLAESAAENGCPYPNIVGFIDGTARPICRPSYNQREFYSGYKKKHVLKYQSIVFTNGLIGRLDGPFVGRRHDAAVLHLSKMLNEMSESFVNDDGSWFAVYGDPGYSNQKFIKVGYKNHAILSQAQKSFNAEMSALRVSVEYGFGKILQQFAFLDFQKSQKYYHVQLKEMYYVAAFLINCQSCIRGTNQVSDIFGSQIPSLSEYLFT